MPSLLLSYSCTLQVCPKSKLVGRALDTNLNRTRRSSLIPPGKARIVIYTPGSSSSTHSLSWSLALLTDTESSPDLSISSGPLNHSIGVHGGGGGGGGQYSSGLSDARENLMKRSPSLHHLVCGKCGVAFPCPVVVSPGCPPWSSMGRSKCHRTMYQSSHKENMSVAIGTERKNVA